MKQHLTEREVLEYGANSIEPDRLDDVDVHLHLCADCRSRVRFAGNLEKALQHFPPAQTSAQFTGQVVKRLGLMESPSFAWSFVKYLAPVFALTVVVGIMYFVLQYAGSFTPSQVRESVETGQSVFHTVGGKISTGVVVLNQWTQKYFSFAFAKNVQTLTTFLITFFCAIALLDKFIFSPMMRRKF